MTKGTFCTIAGTLGGIFTYLFGGWTVAMTTLLIFMVVDYISGLAVAGIFKASTKSENGALESKAGWKGLIRKGFTLLIVLIAYRLDLTIGTAYIQGAVIIGFIANEGISIIENAGLMGLPLPKALAEAIDLLTKKEGVE